MTTLLVILGFCSILALIASMIARHFLRAHDDEARVEAAADRVKEAEERAEHAERRLRELQTVFGGVIKERDTWVEHANKMGRGHANAQHLMLVAMQEMAHRAAHGRHLLLQSIKFFEGKVATATPGAQQALAVCHAADAALLGVAPPPGIQELLVEYTESVEAQIKTIPVDYEARIEAIVADESSGSAV